MSNVQQLTVGLSNLASESKRRYTDVRHGCDTALADCKLYQPNKSIHDITNEQHRQHIIAPFVASCRTGNAKIATIAIPTIHKLIMAGVVPSGSLGSLVDSLMEASHLAVDIQLRILQSLPSLMQNYTKEFTGELLVKLLALCSSLTTNNKSTVVINTASATLQQLFSNVFDKYKEHTEETERNLEITIDNNEIIKVDAIALEGFSVFQDITHAIENEKQTYLNDTIHMKVTSALEIIENILTNHKETFHSHQELAYLLRVKVIPSLLRILNSPHKNFPLITRTMRVIHVLLATQLKNLEIESEIVLSFLNHILLNNEGGAKVVNWEKILVLEMFKSLFTDFRVLKSIYETYDNSSRKKNVIHELVSILSTFLSYNSYLFNDIVKPLPKFPTRSDLSSAPTSHDGAYPIYLSKVSSTMKVAIIDHLDKSEPPLAIPQTYPVFLIYNILLAYADGIAKFVQSLSDNSDTNNLEADVEFTNAFIESCFTEISALFEKFIYTSMDDDAFHLLVRSLQRYTHTTGLLGLGKLRDKLLIIISTSVTRNTLNEETNNGSSSGFSEQGKQLFAFGESLVESFGATLQPHIGDGNSNNAQPVQLRSRYFNSRHVTCLRALANLAVSLGSTLQDSWKIIWKTFQWCDYFLYGPDEYSGYYNHKSYKNFTDSMLPQLSTSDISNYDFSRRKMFDSLSEYPAESFQRLLEALIQLSELSFEVEEDSQEVELNEKSNESNESIDDDLEVCPYNKTFYLLKVLSFAENDSNQYLIKFDKPWDSFCKYFIKLGTRRDLNYNLRIFIITTFNDIVKSVADQGFKSADEITIRQTSEKSLGALNNYLVAMFELGIPQELLVLNCETELHLLTLTTLHELIDKYDTYYQSSWHTVFTIINTPFKTVGSLSEDNNLKEKNRLLIEKSFDTLKLILDEFMSSLPYDQLKLLIDTLHNFCSQHYDLNISFSSVSYFWMISDSLKSRISIVTEMNRDELNKEQQKLTNISELTAYIDTHDSKESYLFYILVDDYLLSTLVKLSFDDRAQVRDGSIQTFFQIIDVHGALLTASMSWDLFYRIVLPDLLSVKVINSANIGDWVESLNLILSGVIALYGKFMMDFNEIPKVHEKWERLIQYFNDLLDLKSIELNLKVFGSFQDLLISFRNVDISKIHEFNRIRTLLFKFWVGIPIEYDFVNVSYQESVTSLMDCFPALYNLIAGQLTLEEVNTILTVLNKCARNPVLPTSYLDNVRPSKLQSSVIKNLTIISSSDPKIQSQVIQQLSNILVYPFGIRSTIESKLSSNKLITNKFKIPTFIAISHISIKLLKTKLKELADSKVLVEDKGIIKVLKSLLEIISSKSVGIETEEQALWIEASEILKDLVEQLIKDKNVGGDKELWRLIINAVKLCYEYKDQGAIFEDFNIKQYQELSRMILPTLLEDSQHQELISDWIESIYRNSYLYEFDELETSIMAENESTEDLVTHFSNFDFDGSFGSTKPLVKHRNKITRFNCLTELIRFCQDPVNEQLNVTSQYYFACRASLCLRRFISDAKLLNRCPIAKVQEEELILVLNGLADIKSVTQENRDNLRKLYPLVVKLVPFTSRISGLDVLVEKVLHRF
ncbi:hypothetical protein G9P44_001218 [Scheffersomyces stipitis]|nr:hypothetical protein G9P44_001218 [Scheffersomyces stipitis]